MIEKQTSLDWKNLKRKMKLKTHLNRKRERGNFIKILHLYRNTQKLKKEIVKILADDRNKERTHREKILHLGQKHEKPKSKKFIICLAVTFALFAVSARIAFFSDKSNYSIESERATFSIFTDPPPKTSIDSTESTPQEEEEFEEPIEGIYDYSNCVCRYRGKEKKREVCQCKDKKKILDNR